MRENTTQIVDALRRLLKRTTPGPWWRDLNGLGIAHKDGRVLCGVDAKNMLCDITCTDADLEFIVNIGSILPNLLTEWEADVRRLDSVIEQLAACKHSRKLLQGRITALQAELRIGPDEEKDTESPANVGVPS